MHGDSEIYRLNSAAIRWLWHWDENSKVITSYYSLIERINSNLLFAALKELPAQMERFTVIKDNYHASEATLQEFDATNGPKINELQKVTLIAISLRARSLTIYL